MRKKVLAYLLAHTYRLFNRLRRHIVSWSGGSGTVARRRWFGVDSGVAHICKVHAYIEEVGRQERNPKIKSTVFELQGFDLSVRSQV